MTKDPWIDRPSAARAPGAPGHAVLPSLLRLSGLLIPLALLGLGCASVIPPHVVLITIDTLRADHLGCYGYDRPTSPNIDRLAAEGMLFERAFTSLPRTTQSIASILTGKYPKGHGARGLFSKVPAANLMLAEILKEEGYATAAVVSNMFLRPGQGFEQGFDLYDNPSHRWEGDSADEVTAVALRWLQNRPPDDPFFLWVHYLDPHWTYAPKPPHDRVFDPDYEEPFTLYDDLRAGLLTKGEVIFQNRLTARQVEHVVSLYDGEIRQTDTAIARLLDRIDLLADPVLVVLTSDHGESLGEHQYFFAHGEYLYEQGLWVPLLFRLPGRVPAGARVDALVQNIDIAPTILALLGIDRLQSVEGQPLLLPEAEKSREAVRRYRPARGRPLVFAESDYQLIHRENPRYHKPGPIGKWSSASDGDHKLIHIPRPGGDLLELYDLRSDPGEMRDLAGEAGATENRDRLLRRLRQFVDYGTGPPQPDLGALDPTDRERLRSLGYIN